MCHVWWIQQMNQNFPAKQFLPVHQRNMWSCIILMEHYVFCWLTLVIFHQVLLSVGLSGSSTVRINCLVFQKEIIIEDSLPIHTHSITFFEWKSAFSVLVVVHFTCSIICSIAHCGIVSTFHHLSQFVLNAECFFHGTLHTLHKIFLFVFKLNFYLSWYSKAFYVENVAFLFHVQD